MGDQKDTSGHGPGVESGKASDLKDSRQGTYDSAANPPKADTSKTTSRERAQPGAAMQGEPIPASNVQVPEGLKRKPIGPYSKDKGRG